MFIGTVLGLIWGSFLIFVPPSPWAVIYNKKENDDDTSTKSEVSYKYILSTYICIVNTQKLLDNSQSKFQISINNIIYFSHLTFLKLQLLVSKSWYHAVNVISTYFCMYTYISFYLNEFVLLQTKRNKRSSNRQRPKDRFYWEPADS